MQHATAAVASSAVQGSVVSTKLHTSPHATPLRSLHWQCVTPLLLRQYIYIHPCSTVAVRPLTVITAAACPSFCTRVCFAFGRGSGGHTVKKDMILYTLYLYIIHVSIISRRKCPRRDTGNMCEVQRVSDANESAVAAGTYCIIVTFYSDRSFSHHHTDNVLLLCTL